MKQSAPLGISALNFARASNPQGSEKPIRVLLIESGVTGGGAFESLWQYLQVLDRQQVAPWVVYLNPTAYLKRTRELNIPVFLLADWRYSLRVQYPLLRRSVNRFLSYWEARSNYIYWCLLRLWHAPLIRHLVWIIRKHRIQVIHLNDQIQRDLFGVITAARTGVKCISCLRSTDGAHFNQQRACHIDRYVSFYIANSQATARYWQQYLPAHKFRILYNAIAPPKLLATDFRQQWGLLPGTRVVCCVARLVTCKGHAFLLRAFARYRDPRVVLLLVGDGPCKNALQHQVRELGLSKRVIFTGYQEQAQHIIAQADLLVLSSQHEGFGRVLLEALQVGTPVVATRCGGIPEIISHDWNGLLVEFGDEEGLVQAMRRLLHDTVLREKCIRNGYRTMRDKFDIQHYARRMYAIYQQALTL